MLIRNGHLIAALETLDEEMGKEFPSFSEACKAVIAHIGNEQWFDRDDPIVEIV